MENYKIVTHKGGRGRFLLGAVSGIFLQIQWGECTRAREKRGSPYHTFSHMHGHLRVLRVSRRTKKKRETARSLRSVKRGFQLLGFDWNVFRVFDWCHFA